MIRPLLFLVLVATCAAPSQALGASSGADSGQRILPCGLRVSSEDTSAYHTLKCLVGTAVGVSAHAMRVQPAHGPVRRFRFTDETQFETNSGEGALNGLLARDRVCVAYTSLAQTLTARIVAFSPRSNPCRAGTRRTPGPDSSGQD